jgi:hypothetical protein
VRRDELQYGSPAPALYEGQALYFCQISSLNATIKSWHSIFFMRFSENVFCLFPLRNFSPALWYDSFLRSGFGLLLLSLLLPLANRYMIIKKFYEAFPGFFLTRNKCSCRFFRA